MEALPPAGYNGRSLTLSSLLVVLLLASRASPSHSSNIGVSAAAAASSLRNHSHSLTRGGRIADDMGLEYLIDSLHVPARILAGDPYATYATNDASQPAGCGRTAQKGKPYRPCTPSPNPDPHCSVYNRGC
ncbi:hypothetical protein ACJRO7_016677 [Eucalyptus globulus]|uniref:Uncharacterized protein n=1 Tax=Eucalyptus globulus TaxID=34317 RepID=A0ABD3L8N4_EUCGL